MNSKSSRIRQRGFSLAEVLVATAILVVILVGILTLYDRANRVFKSGNEAADMQQNVRIAYERLVGDIRMAGFDYKRGGILLPGQDAAPWAPGRAYSASTLVTPPTPNGHTYRATNAGTSGPSQPGWLTGVGLTFIEGGATPPITWQENGGAVYEQPDEQVEYAGGTALTIRGNFDYSANEAGDIERGREPAYESSQFPVVTTDNQEIVTYALVSDTAAAGTAPNNQTITMFIDMNNGGAPSRTSRPGGNAERQVDITGVDLTNNNPPYTLYRFNFADDGSVQRTPLASNIRSLNFFYFEDAQAAQPLRDESNVLAPNIGGGGAYDPAVPNSINLPARHVRKKIRAIRVRLLGMNSQPDVNYVDTSTANGQLGATSSVGTPSFVTDTATVSTSQRPMNNYRRIAVDTVVVPRNLGMSGMAQTLLQPPPRPTITNVCVGYCGIATISWNPNTTNPNASFAVMWDHSANGSFSNAFDAGTSNTYAMDLTQEDLSQPFYFKLRAYNAGGSVFSDLVPAGLPGAGTYSAGPYYARNSTVPQIPNTLVASGGGGASPNPIAGRIRVTWASPTTNASGNVTCDVGSPTVTNYVREIKGFRIYRGTASNFNAGPGTRILSETASGSAAPIDDGYGNYTWDDTNVVCGTSYYYRIRTVEWCFIQGSYNTSGNASDSLSNYDPPNASAAIPGMSGTTGVPQTPVNFLIAPDVPNTPPIGLTASSCDPVANVCSVNMDWGRVTTTTAPVQSVSIDTYQLQRRQYAMDPISGLYVLTGVNATLTFTGALTAPAPGSTPPAADPSTVYYTDSVPYIDLTTGARYKYDYTVTALQANPPTGSCQASQPSATKQYPPPCTFTGSVIVQTGASAGNGLTPGTAWVMNAGDTIAVNPPGGTTFTNTDMQIVDPGGTTIAIYTSATSPANFTWANLTPGTPYTVTFTMTSAAIAPALPCTEQLVRYIQQEPLPACSLTTFATQASILRQTATNYQLQLDLVNGAAEQLNLQSIDFEWTAPTRITWNSIKFPSAAGATVAGPGTTSYVTPPGPSFTIALNPRPAQLTLSDVTVPASGTRSLLLNFAATNGNPSNVLPSAISFICIKYQRPSITQLVTGPQCAPLASCQLPITFFCAIKPDQLPNNPTSCR